MSAFRGRLQPLGGADVLAFLRVLNRHGLLSLRTEGAAVGLHLRGGRVVHATSTRDADRLSELLVAWNLITPAQCALAMRRAAAGERLGRALLEAGGLSPQALLDARRRHVRRIAASVFDWDEGEYAFHEGEAPDDAEVEVDLDVTSVLLEGIRSVRNAALFRRRLPFDEWVFDPLAGGGAAVALEPHEQYVARLVDGRRTLGEITRLSEFGRDETLRTIFLLFTVGRLKMAQAPADPAEEAGRDGLDGLLSRYNGMFGIVYRHMMQEVGPISEHLLARSLNDMTAAHPALFHSASLGGDGTVDAERLRRNLRALGPARRRDTLVQGLNELLYAELLVLRRTLGPDHEGRVLRAFRDARLRDPS